MDSVNGAGAVAVANGEEADVDVTESGELLGPLQKPAAPLAEGAASSLFLNDEIEAHC